MYIHTCDKPHGYSDTYLEGGMYVTLLHVSVRMLHFSLWYERRTQTSTTRPKALNSPRLNTHGPEYPDGISKSCP